MRMCMERGLAFPMVRGSLCVPGRRRERVQGCGSRNHDQVSPPSSAIRRSPGGRSKARNSESTRPGAVPEMAAITGFWHALAQANRLVQEPRNCRSRSRDHSRPEVRRDSAEADKRSDGINDEIKINRGCAAKFTTNNAEQLASPRGIRPAPR